MSLNDVVRRYLVTAGVPALLEPPGLERENGKKPDGLTLVPWRRGKAAVWDVTCVDTLAPSHLDRSLICAGSAANFAETKKQTKYKELSNSYIFVPVGFETYGPFGAQAASFLTEIGRRISAKSGERRSVEFLFQRISIEIQRGNAASVLGTNVAARGFDELFYILSARRASRMAQLVAVPVAQGGVNPLQVVSDTEISVSNTTCNV